MLDGQILFKAYYSLPLFFGGRYLSLLIKTSVGILRRYKIKKTVRWRHWLGLRLLNPWDLLSVVVINVSFVLLISFHPAYVKHFISKMMIIASFLMELYNPYCSQKDDIKTCRTRGTFNPTLYFYSCGTDPAVRLFHVGESKGRRAFR